MTNAYLGINLSEEEKRRIRRAAAEEDATMSELSRNILSEWLDENTTEQQASK